MCNHHCTISTLLKGKLVNHREDLTLTGCNSKAPGPGCFPDEVELNVTPSLRLREALAANMLTPAILPRRLALELSLKGIQTSKQNLTILT